MLKEDAQHTMHIMPNLKGVKDGVSAKILFVWFLCEIHYKHAIH